MHGGEGGEGRFAWGCMSCAQALAWASVGMMKISWDGAYKQAGGTGLMHYAAVTQGLFPVGSNSGSWHQKKRNFAFPVERV